jgi:hypothetical protein
MALNNHIDTDMIVDFLRNGDGDAILVLLAPVIHKAAIEWMWIILQKMLEWMWTALQEICKWLMIVIIFTGKRQFQ